MDLPLLDNSYKSNHTIYGGECFSSQSGKLKLHHLSMYIYKITTLYILNLHNFMCQFYLNKTEKRSLCFSLHFLLVLTLKIIQSWELRCFLGLHWACAQPCSWVLPSRFLSLSQFFFPKPFGLFTDCPSHYTLSVVSVAQALEMFLTNVALYNCLHPGLPRWH